MVETWSVLFWNLISEPMEFKFFRYRKVALVCWIRVPE